LIDHIVDLDKIQAFFTKYPPKVRFSQSFIKGYHNY